MPEPYVTLTPSLNAEVLRQIEEQRQAREARMRNALEILADVSALGAPSVERLSMFVRATARGGLGRE
jgi:hypothetical protein